MPTGNTATIAASTIPVTSPHSAYDYLVALGTLWLPITVLLVLVGLLLVAFRLIEVDAGLGKAVFKVRRPGSLPALDTPTTLRGAVEDLPAAAPAPLEIAGQAAPAESEATANDSTQDNSGSPSGWEYIKARSVSDLDANWGAWRESVDVAHLEFWETDYRRRRANYGADHGRDRVRQLAADNPGWAFPYAVLVDWSIADHDFDAAAAHLAAGLTRQSSSQFGELLRAGVTLHHKTGGSRSALEFCLEWSKAQLPERNKALLFYTLSTLLKEHGDVEGYRIAYEWALLLQPFDRPKAFSLAYNYADSTSHWAPAMFTYESTVDHQDNGAVSLNNLAILLGHFDKAAQIDSYEQAVAGGDAFAVANLARLLISDGYIAAGERLLATVTVPGASAELHAGSASAALAARRSLDDKQTEIAGLLKRQVEPYYAAVAKSFRHLQSEGMTATGYFVSADGLTQVFIDEQNAHCRMRIGVIDYSGVLRWQGTCYAGQVRWDGGGLLGFGFDATLLYEGAGLVHFLQWPTTIAPEQGLVIQELRHSVSEPSALLAPVTPPQALGLASLLPSGNSTQES